MLLSEEQVIQLIPQKAPFVMIDKLIESNDESTTSGLNIKDENIFTENGCFTEPGLVENIAQTGAIRAGYEFKKLQEQSDKELEPPVGFIGAIKSLSITKLPKTGQNIETTIKVENQVFDITMVSGEVKCEGELIASCQMKIFVQDSSKMQAPA